MAAAPIRAGSAFVELFTKNARLDAGLRAASMRLRAFGAAVTGMGARIAGIGAIIAAPFVLAAKTFADMGSELVDVSDRTGIAIETLQELKFAAEQSGAGMEELEAGIRTMSRTIGSGGMSVAARLEAVAEQLNAIEDPAQRAAQAQAIFGRAGTRLLPMLRDLAQLRQEARSRGLIISEQDARNAEAFGDSLSALGMGLKRIVFAIGGALAPAFKRLSDALGVGAGGIIEFLDRNKGLVQIIFAAVAAVTALGLAMLVLGPIISAVGLAFGVLAGAVSFLLTPFGLITAAAAAVGVVLLRSSQQGNEALRSIPGTARTAFQGVMDAMATGDLGGAFEIAVLGLRVIWEDFCTWFGDTFIGRAVSAVIDGLNEISLALGQGGVGQTVARRLTPLQADAAMVEFMGGTLMPGRQEPTPELSVRDQLQRRAQEVAQEVERQRKRQPFKEFLRGFSGAQGAAALESRSAAGSFAGSIAQLVGSSQLSKIEDATKQTAQNTRGILQRMNQGGGGLPVT